MKKNIKIIISGIVLLTIIILILIFSILHKKPEVNNNLNIDYFVSNKSWGTLYNKQMFFRKGDFLEFLYIIKNPTDKSKKISVNTGDLKNKLGLDDISVNLQDSIISGNKATVLKVTGKSKDGGNTPSDINDLKNILKYEDITDENKDLKPDEPKVFSGNSILKMSFDSYNYSSNIDNLVKINSNTSNIKSIGIGEKFFNIIIISGENYILIPSKTFSSGKYFLTAILKNNEIVGIDNSFNFNLSDKQVVVMNIFPDRFPNDTDRWITVQGIGLKNTLSVQLSNNTIFQKTDFNIVSDNVLAVKIPSGVAEGTYFINIMTLNGIFEFPDNKFQIYYK